MEITFAPMEGITNYIFRRIHHEFFGGVARYYTPFLAPQPKKGLKKKDWQEILPDNNQGITLIPQIITNHAKDMIDLSLRIAELGYKEINLNLGCPSGTVVSGKKGAGFLGEPEALLSFLDEVFEVFERENLHLSIKTRVGMRDTTEWEKLLEIYRQFPLTELIIHPRLREDYYRKPVHLECYQMAYEQMGIPLYYNGDIVDEGSYKKITMLYSKTQGIMIGRGLLSEPGLADALLNSATSITQLRKQYPDYLEALAMAYREVLSGDGYVLDKLKELGCYLLVGTPGYAKEAKRLRETHNLTEYRIIARELLENQ